MDVIGQARQAFINELDRDFDKVFARSLPIFKRSQKGLIAIEVAIKGGPGSGNFGHDGRPGEVGGSASGNSTLLLYHGTSATYIKSIKRHGLVAGRGKGADAWAKKRGWNVQQVQVDGQEISVFVTPDPSLAKTYSQYASEMSNGTPVILAVRVPPDRQFMLKDDENQRDGLRFEGTIPPEWIDFDYTDSRKDLDQIFIVAITDERRAAIKGGPGSGNFDHAGRPGEVGGSAPRDAVGGPDDEYDPRTYFQKRSAIVTTASEWKKIAERLRKLHQDGEISNPFTYLMKTLQDQGQMMMSVPKDLFVEFAKDDLGMGFKWLEYNRGEAIEGEIFKFLSDTGKPMPEIIEAGMKVNTPFTFLSPEKWADLPGANFEKVLNVAGDSPYLFGEKGGYKILGAIMKRESVGLDYALSHLKGRFISEQVLPRELVDELIANTQSDQASLRSLPLLLDVGADDMPEVWREKMADYSIFVSDEGENIGEAPANHKQLKEWLRGRDYNNEMTYSPSRSYAADAARRKDLVSRAIASDTGLSVEESSNFLKQWSISSNDTDMRSLGIQEIAADEFDVSLSPWQKGQIKRAKGYRPAYLFEEDGSQAEAKRKIRSAVKSTYNQTQKTLEDLGVDYVHVYRGVALPGQEKLKPGSIISFNDGAFSSWSISPAIARDFAHDEGGIVVSMVVPRKRVYSTSLTGPGCASEEEVIVIGKKKPSKAVVEFVHG